MTTSATDLTRDPDEGDVLDRLGFAPGPDDEPLLTWPRPTVRPTVRRRPRGRHRALRPRSA